jgi:hypothetical protein
LPNRDAEGVRDPLGVIEGQLDLSADRHPPLDPLIVRAQLQGETALRDLLPS